MKKKNEKINGGGGGLVFRLFLDEFPYIMRTKCFYAYNIHVKGIYMYATIIVHYVNTGACYMYHKIQYVAIRVP